jgi:hypothetical protein
MRGVYNFVENKLANQADICLLSSVTDCMPRTFYKYGLIIRKKISPHEDCMVKPD